MLSVGTREVTACIDDRFHCARCGAVGGWSAFARPQRRRNSTIYWLACAQCGDRIAAKAVLLGDRHDQLTNTAREEYATLRQLQAEFPHDDRYGTLAPLGYLEVPGCGIVITRWIEGRNLARALRSLDGRQACEALHAAGRWLGKLHEGDRRNLQRRPLDVVDKLDSLDGAAGVHLRADPEVREILELLAQVGACLEGQAVPVARMHGDFKPGNMMCDGSRYVGLDVQWRTIGAVVYDLAPFLNHVWMRGPGTRSARFVRRYDLAGASFLDGYGYTEGLRVLEWAQLYFALHYFCMYRERGMPGRAYANWKVLPLARELARRLRDAR